MADNQKSKRSNFSKKTQKSMKSSKSHGNSDSDNQNAYGDVGEDFNPAASPVKKLRVDEEIIEYDENNIFRMNSAQDLGEDDETSKHSKHSNHSNHSKHAKWEDNDNKEHKEKSLFQHQASKNELEQVNVNQDPVNSNSVNNTERQKDNSKNERENDISLSGSIRPQQQEINPRAQGALSLNLSGLSPRAQTQQSEYSLSQNRIPQKTVTPEQDYSQINQGGNPRMVQDNEYSRNPTQYQNQNNRNYDGDINNYQQTFSQPGNNQPNQNQPFDRSSQVIQQDSRVPTQDNNYNFNYNNTSNNLSQNQAQVSERKSDNNSNFQFPQQDRNNINNISHNSQLNYPQERNSNNVSKPSSQISYRPPNQIQPVDRKSDNSVNVNPSSQVNSARPSNNVQHIEKPLEKDENYKMISNLLNDKQNLEKRSDKNIKDVSVVNSNNNVDPNNISNHQPLNTSHNSSLIQKTQAPSNYNDNSKTILKDSPIIKKADNKDNNYDDYMTQTQKQPYPESIQNQPTNYSNLPTNQSPNHPNKTSNQPTNQLTNQPTTQNLKTNSERYISATQSTPNKHIPEKDNVNIKTAPSINMLNNNAPTRYQEESNINYANYANNNNNNLENSATGQQLKKKNPSPNLKFLTVCSYCQVSFNKEVNIPYLFKCGHFFCKVCVETKFTDKTSKKVFCPENDQVANSISELKVLKGLLQSDENNIDDEALKNRNGTMEKRKNYCQYHPDQMYSHYVEDTKEIICVYCAFIMFKENPHQEIKEIKSKTKEILMDLNRIISEEQIFIDTVQKAENEMKKTQKDEEEIVHKQFSYYMQILEEKKNDILENIRKNNQNNNDKLSSKLGLLSKKTEETENFKKVVKDLTQERYLEISSILNNFNEISKRHADQRGSYFEYIDYKFMFEESNKFFRYVSTSAELNNKVRQVNFFNGPKNSGRDMFTTFEPNRKLNQMSQASQHISNKPSEISKSGGYHDFALTDNRSEAFIRKYNNELLFGNNSNSNNFEKSPFKKNSKMNTEFGLDSDIKIFSDFEKFKASRDYSNDKEFENLVYEANRDSHNSNRIKLNKN